MNFDKIRNDFPALFQKVNKNKLVYFDNAATTIKPKVVIEAISDYYRTINSNVHRTGHYLSLKSTEKLESTRENVRRFINAKESSEIVFTKGTTESINAIAEMLLNNIFRDGDEIILTRIEHHSNIVPWVGLKEKINVSIKILDIDINGNLKSEDLNELFTEKTKVLSIAHSSNVLGITNPVKDIIKKAKSRGVITVVDGAQSIVHEKVDVQDLDCDFYCFSGHKVYGPMGIGILYGKKSILAKLAPYQKGGGMIEKVDFDKVVYTKLPHKFEAGTPNVGGAIGLSKAIDYISSIGLDNIKKQEQNLLQYATQRLIEIDGLEIYGNSDNRDPIISFNIRGIHHSDLAMILDKFGIATRSGTHCAQPLMNFYGIEGSTRISFAFYNTTQEIDYFCEKLIFAINMLK